ncbi:MAG: hypothetical protein LC808_08960, partial [Actinobacteria bacterium]|nr:hypothetical protein [Actinomycetota bacterium]
PLRDSREPASAWNALLPSWGCRTLFAGERSFRYSFTAAVPKRRRGDDCNPRGTTLSATGQTSPTREGGLEFGRRLVPAPQTGSRSAQSGGLYDAA